MFLRLPASPAAWRVVRVPAKDIFRGFESHQVHTRTSIGDFSLLHNNQLLAEKARERELENIR